MKIEMRRYNGTTLIELMVVLFIIALMLGVVSLNYRKSQYRSELKNSAEQVKDVMSQTRRYSLAPRINAAANTAGYCFIFKALNDVWTWEIKEYVSTTPEVAALKTCANAISIENSNFSSSISFQNLSNYSDGYPTYAWTPSIVVGQPISAEAGSTTLKHTHLDSDKKINITQEGIINIE